MKCIKFYKKYGNSVARVSDAEADAAVASKKARYIPKRTWRKER